MNLAPKGKPVVLAIAGHDPCGGAGVQADIEAIGATGCHAVTVITSFTAQNTQRVGSVRHQDPGFFADQIELLLEDMPVQACKIGLVADLQQLGIIERILTERLTDIPIVLDPVISAGSGHVFMDNNVCGVLRDSLLPLATIVTPNSLEARELSGRDDLDQAAAALLERGAGAVLITGGHENGEKITNSLYTSGGTTRRYSRERLPGTYHGSGCTLSSSLAARLARGEELAKAVELAQDYTWHALRHACQYGHQQQHPDRMFRCGDPEPRP
jgi:hydroxymethylpyrimidine/phosphomethylpyrimidine kinase